VGASRRHSRVVQFAFFMNSSYREFLSAYCVLLGPNAADWTIAYYRIGTW